MMLRIDQQRARRWAGLLIVAVFAAGCSSTTATTAPTAVMPTTTAPTATVVPTAAAPSPTEAASGGITISVPASVSQYYAGYQYFVPLQPNPYASWNAPTTPAKLCWNDSYLGNTWRQDSLAEFQKLYTQLQTAGVIASGDAEVTNSNGDVDLQITQLGSEVRDGCNVIITIAGSTSGMCTAIHNAAQKGVLVITDESPVNCPDGINVTFNPYWDMAEGTKAVAEAMSATGNVIITEGLPGYNQTVAADQAIKDVLANYPNIKVLGSVNGQWTASIAKSEMIKFLATHPQTVNGVLDSGAMAAGAIQALVQTGRPMAKVNNFSGECSFFALANQYPTAATNAVFQSGTSAAYEAVEVALRMLNGQQPTVQTLIYPLTEVQAADFSKYYDSTMTVQSTCYAGPKKAVDDSYFDPLFAGGKTPSVTLTP